MQQSRGLVVVMMAVLAGCRFEAPEGVRPEPDGSVPDGSIPDGSIPGKFGDGKDGALSAVGTLSINRCHVLESVDSNRIRVSNWTDEMPNRRVILHQVQDKDIFKPSGNPMDIDAARTGDAGRWQEVTVTSINRSGSAPVLTVNPPPAFAFSSSPTEGRNAQACTVPEYTNVDVPATVVLEASPWNGSTGGILAFYANGTVTVAGSLDATARGFRGGRRGPVTSGMNETRLDTMNGAGGGKGESLDGGSWSREGRGNAGNGAGGGNADRSGGGGGGGAGVGGYGGFQFKNLTPDTRGMPGARVTFPLEERWSFGGGGGAGHAQFALLDPSCTDDIGRGSNGGTGGGIIWIMAATLNGNGVIAADGQRGQCAWLNGAGGAGAGGTVRLRVEEAGFTGTLHADGGTGGTTYHPNTDGRGPGGGGGGGFIVIDGPLSNPQTSVTGGMRGAHINTTNAMSDLWGAADGNMGEIVLHP